MTLQRAVLFLLSGFVKMDGYAGSRMTPNLWRLALTRCVVAGQKREARLGA
jgi:hypothetical protein